MRCVVSCGSTSFPWLVFFFGALLWVSMIHKSLPVKNLTGGTGFSLRLFVISVRLCRMVVFIVLKHHPLVSLILTLFQDHGCVRQLKQKIYFFVHSHLIKSKLWLFCEQDLSHYWYLPLWFVPKRDSNVPFKLIKRFSSVFFFTCLNAFNVIMNDVLLMQ